MMFAQLFRDNPILVKHIRARLRRQHLIPWVAVVFILSTCIAYAGYSSWQQMREQILKNHDPSYYFGISNVPLYQALTALLILQAVILFLVGVTQVAGSVAQARENGILDFHRISPLRPVTMALGFLLGGSIREYLLYACTLPAMIVVISLLGKAMPPSTVVQFIAVTLTASLLYHAIALLVSLSVPKARSAAPLTGFVIVVLHLGNMVPFLANLTLIPMYRQAFDTSESSSPFTDLSFFGDSIPLFVLALMHLIPLFIFFFYGAVRKMRHERAYAFAKPVAVFFFAVLGLLFIGDNLKPYLRRDDRFIAMLMTLAEFCISGLVFSLLITPNAGDFLKGLRHARKRGGARAPVWSDFAVNLAPMLSLCVLFVLGLAAYLSVPVIRYPGMNVLAVALAVCALCYFGLGKQAFDLIFRKNGVIYFALLFFVLWVVPFLLGMVSAFAQASESTILKIFSLNPFIGSCIGFLTNTEGSPQRVGEWQSMLELSLYINGAYLLVFSWLYAFAIRRAGRLALRADEERELNRGAVLPAGV